MCKFAREFKIISQGVVKKKGVYTTISMVSCSIVPYIHVEKRFSFKSYTVFYLRYAVLFVLAKQKDRDIRTDNST